MWIVGYLIVCLLIADFISGLFHWLEDRYDFSNIPYVGGFINEYISKPNLEHHTYPQRFLNGDFWYRNYTTMIPAFASAIIVFYINPLFCLPFIMAGFSNEIHAFAHRKGKLPVFIEVLQDVGVFQNPRHHALHHTSPNNRYYCVITNFLNPILEQIKFWDRLEKLLLVLNIKVK
jgi:hypothetical protein